MNTYKIKMERNTVKTEVVTIEIEADNEADARVLAKYREINEWNWAGDGPAKMHGRVIRSIEVDHHEADGSDPAWPDGEQS